MNVLPLEGKVAAIINERELVINIGANKGVRKGMKFKVLAGEVTEVRDPETDEVLGTIEQEKVQVRVIEVQNKLSVCRTFRTYTVGHLTLPNLFEPRRTEV